MYFLYTGTCIRSRTMMSQSGIAFFIKFTWMKPIEDCADAFTLYHSPFPCSTPKI